MSSIGIGLRGDHFEQAVNGPHPIDWFEVHTENYFGRGGKPHHYLTKIRQDYPVSFHGVALSIGSTDPLSDSHLKNISELIDRYQPMLVSDHLTWSSIGGTYLHDLLPLPFTKEAADHVVGRIEAIQDTLRQQILIENASTYLEFNHSELSECEFMVDIAERSGCGILLDVNNIYVNSRNHGIDAISYIESVPESVVQEIHLAGHTVNKFDDGEVLIDTHDQRVCDDVWNLYGIAAKKFPTAATLIEWDKDLPDFSVLLEEATIARSIHQQSERHAAA